MSLSQLVFTKQSSFSKLFSKYFPSPHQPRTHGRRIHLHRLRDLRGRLRQIVKPVKNLPILIRQRQKCASDGLTALALIHPLPERLQAYERIILIAGGLMMIKPGMLTDIAGFVLFALVLVSQWQRKKAQRAAA